METKNKYKPWKIAKNVLGTAGFLGIMGLSLSKTVDNYAPFTEADYQKAEWIQSSALPDQAYNAENIPHNLSTKNFYLEQVKKKNGSLEGAVLFPDLDGNGKVGK